MGTRLAYHYCSIESLFHIINSKVLWLNDSDYMNDKYESMWIDQIVLEIFKEFKRSKIFKQKKLKKWKKFYKKLNVQKQYLICFSSEKDLLSQWRGYGDDGKGVVIGFNLDGFLAKTYGITSGKSITPKIGIEKVAYNPHNEIKKNIQELKDISHLQIIKDMASRIKHDTFSEEKETRLVYSPENNDTQNTNSWHHKELDKISDKKYRISNNNIISYYEYSFKCNLEFVHSIILGPKCNLDENTLKEFLISNKVENVAIETSHLSYK